MEKILKYSTREYVDSEKQNKRRPIRMLVVQKSNCMRYVRFKKLKNLCTLKSISCRWSTLHYITYALLRFVSQQNLRICCDFASTASSLSLPTIPAVGGPAAKGLTWWFGQVASLFIGICSNLAWIQTGSCVKKPSYIFLLWFEGSNSPNELMNLV